MDWGKYGGAGAAAVAVALRDMMAEGIGPDEALAQYDAWMAALLRDMVPVSPDYAARVSKLRAKALGGIEMGPGEDLAGPCPRCGRPVIGHELLCRVVSPTWRTQLACSDVDGCGWHAVSRMTLRSLRRLGLRGNVENEGVA